MADLIGICIVCGRPSVHWHGHSFQNKKGSPMEFSNAFLAVLINTLIIAFLLVFVG